VGVIADFIGKAYRGIADGIFGYDLFISYT
jgi:hypothetical protein